MILHDITMVCGDTSRARCYLQALTARNLNPAACIVLPDEGKPLPGQNAKGNAIPSLQASWGTFYPDLSVRSTCHEKNIPVIQAPENNINSDASISLLAKHSASVYIYAGFGGVLLRKQVLRCGKPFLHVHGGWLPDYKGSTTNHYSYAAFILLLFFQRSFKSPAGPKPRGITGGDVNRLAGPGVAPGSSLPVITIEGAKVHQ